MYSTMKIHGWSNSRNSTTYRPSKRLKIEVEKIDNSANVRLPNLRTATPQVIFANNPSEVDKTCNEILKYYRVVEQVLVVHESPPPG